jgi:RPA family protein
MSDAEDDRPRREVAYRAFGAEFEDATHAYSESDEERAPNYVVTPTGLRVNRLFVVGVLTETEQVSDEVLRARVVDPTGAFVAYAGQYQPDALSFLQRTDPPAFVALTGKARTFTPDDGDRTYTSVRPESLNEVAADTRDKWTVRTAEHTLARVAAFADALDRPDHGADLEATLRAEGLAPALAAGIPRAIEAYGTTTGYLDAIRQLALDAAGVVAGDREEVRSVDPAPDEGGETAIPDFDHDAGVGAVAAAGRAGGAEPTPEPAGADDAEEDSTAETTSVADDAPEETETPGATETATEHASADTDAAAAGSDAIEGPGDFDAGDGADAQTTEHAAAGTSDPESAAGNSEGGGAPGQDDPGPAPDDETAGGPASDPESAPDEEGTGGEMYEFDEEERAEVEEEHGLEFSTGSEVEPADDLDTPGQGDIDADPTGEPAETQAETGSEDTPDDESGAEEGPAGSLEDAVVERMEELADGGAADRETLVESVAEDRGVSPGTVEDAIQDALMSGRCYESGDGEITPI